MNASVIIHRLKVREHELRDAGFPHHAEDIRRAVELIERWERERLLVACVPRAQDAK
jgi:hypothetical protein